MDIHPLRYMVTMYRLLSAHYFFLSFMGLDCCPRMNTGAWIRGLCPKEVRDKCWLCSCCVEIRMDHPQPCAHESQSSFIHTLRSSTNIQISVRWGRASFVRTNFARKCTWTLPTRGGGILRARKQQRQRGGLSRGEELRALRCWTKLQIWHEPVCRLISGGGGS